jgi:hypothetical protein
VRLIYTDEAGTSANEPVTVVAALIVNADSQWMPMAERIRNALAKVPQKYRNGFVFHATEVWGSKKLRDGWSREEREALLIEMMSAPRKCKVPIAYSIYFRDAAAPTVAGLSKEKVQHAHAFGTCMALSDLYVRDYGDSKEIAAVVAEDIPEMRASLREAFSTIRDHGLPIQDARVSFRTGMKPAGSGVGTVNFRVIKIVDVVHFTPKASALILQVADAVAFGLRRYFAGQSHGHEFAQAIVPGMPVFKRTTDCEGGVFFHDKINTSPSV